jgi:hypothetical protein
MRVAQETNFSLLPWELAARSSHRQILALADWLGILKRSVKRQIPVEEEDANAKMKWMAAAGFDPQQIRDIIKREQAGERVAAQVDLKKRKG